MFFFSRAPPSSRKYNDHITGNERLGNVSKHVYEFRVRLWKEVIGVWEKNSISVFGKRLKNLGG
jgi:hypothetical protein